LGSREGLKKVAGVVRVWVMEKVVMVDGREGGREKRKAELN